MQQDGPDTSPETPSSKLRFSTNQSVHLVTVLQSILSRVSILERSSVNFQCRIDRTIESDVLRERIKEIQDDTTRNLECFIQSLDEDERPSQSIVFNVGKSKYPSSTPIRDNFNRITIIVGVVSGIIAAIVEGLRQAGIIK